MPIPEFTEETGQRVLYSLTEQGLAETIASLVNIERGLHGRPAEDAMQEIVEAILHSLDMEYAPRWRGTLVGSIDTDVYTEEEVTYGVVFSDLVYAPAQERGTEPYWPNLDALRDWAEEHLEVERGQDHAFVLARLIAARGLPAKQYFEQSLEANAELIVKLFDDFVAELIETKMERVEVKYLE